jgi:hypothetical protein
MFQGAVPYRLFQSLKLRLYDCIFQVTSFLLNFSLNADTASSIEADLMISASIEMIKNVST